MSGIDDLNEIYIDAIDFIDGLWLLFLNSFNSEDGCGYL